MKSKELMEAEYAELSSSGEEEEDSTLIQDEDECSSHELSQLFNLSYKPRDESAVTLKKDYILSLCNDSSFTRIATGLSNASVHIFDVNQQSGLSHFQLEDASTTPAATKRPSNRTSICGVRFLDETPNCLLIGTTNGLIRLFDLRTQNEQARFQISEQISNEESVTPPKCFTCFDRNANSRIICAGTEKHQSNVFLLFYDVRERKQMGGYFECHQDDVTAVRFHATQTDSLCSGSTDGLINVFDIKGENEDDALMMTINTESSVQKLNWHTNVYEKDTIYCITHTNDFMAYDCGEGDLMAEFKRSKITTAMKRKNPANCNLIDSHNMTDGSAFLLSGTNSNKGEILRSLRFENKQLLPLANFEGNKQIVRESLYDPKSNAIVTAGESSIVSLWTPQNLEESVAPNSDSNKLKSKSKSKSKTNKTTPY